MRASKGSLFCAITLALIFAEKGLAGQQSLLDPYADVQAPQAKSKSHKQTSEKVEEAKEAAAKKKAASESVLSGFETDSPKEQVKQKEPKPEKVKPEGKLVDKPLIKEKPPAKSKPLAEAKSSDTTAESGPGVMSGIKDIQSGYAKAFKAAGSNIVSGSKAAGGKVADGTKKVRDGVASGARSSGEFFLKGARAIGHGFKVTGGKVKDGADSVGSKIAVKPKSPRKVASKDDVKDAQLRSLAANDGETVLDDSKVPGKALPPLSTKPLVKAKGKSGASDKPSLMGRTLGRLNPFSHGNSQQSSVMQAQPQPQAVSDLRQTFPN